jgi:hypothetical protein
MFPSYFYLSPYSTLHHFSGKKHQYFSLSTLLMELYLANRTQTIPTTIRAKAIDSFGAESDWATLDVTMPKIKSISKVFEMQERLFSQLHTQLLEGVL